MDRIDGIYAGNIVWASKYDGGVFSDFIISLEIARNCNQAYITSDIDSLAGQTRIETALAYYAYSLVKKDRKKQNRIYEIICNGSTAELFVIEGFENKEADVILHQKEKMHVDESEEFLASKLLADMFLDKYPENKEIENACDAIKDYEYAVLTGDEDVNDPKVEMIINHIYDQIDFTKDIIHVELFGKSVEISKDYYINSISDDIIDAYVPKIQAFISRISNNLEKDDVLNLYIRNFSNDSRMRKRIDGIAEENLIRIEIEAYTGKFISRGNAYLYYLRNHIQTNRIKENLGRFNLLLNKNYVNLNMEQGSAEFICDTDFEDRYRFRVYDSETKKTIPFELAVPFSMSGSRITAAYSYEPNGLKIELRDINSGETCQEIFEYSK